MSFLISLPFFLIKKSKYKWIFLSWLIFPFLLFSFIFTIKHPRFLMPIFPVTALITAWGIGRIKNKKIQIPIMVFLIVFSLFQFCVLSYCSMDERALYRRRLGILSEGTNYESFPLYTDTLKIGMALDVMREHISFGRFRIGSVIISPGPLERVYWLEKKDRALEVFDLVEMHQAFLDNFDSLDFILFYVSKDSSLFWPAGEEFKSLLKNIHKGTMSRLKLQKSNDLNKLFQLLEESRSDFRLAGEIPDGGAVYYIYKRKEKF